MSRKASQNAQHVESEGAWAHFQLRAAIRGHSGHRNIRFPLILWIADRIIGNREWIDHLVGRCRCTSVVKIVTYGGWQRTRGRKRLRKSSTGFSVDHWGLFLFSQHQRERGCFDVAACCLRYSVNGRMSSCKVPLYFAWRAVLSWRWKEQTGFDNECPTSRSHLEWRRTQQESELTVNLAPRPALLYLSFSHPLSIFACTLKSWKEKLSRESALIFSSIKTQYTQRCVHMLICTGPPLTAPFFLVERHLIRSSF